MAISDGEIIRRINDEDLIVGAILDNVRPKSEISKGISSAGYDLQCDHVFRVMCSAPPVEDRVMDIDGNRPGILDPKNVNPRLFETVVTEKGQALILNPGRYALVAAMEWLNMPSDLIGIILGKSTYARNGIIINCTPAEPGWCGYLTIEIGNIGTIPVLIYPGEGIAQIIFFKVDGTVVSDYEDLGGKYQNQGSLDNFSKVI